MNPAADAPLGIPERYEDVTAEWLTQALRAGGVLDEQAVTDFSVEPISAVRSRLSSLASISVSYDQPSSDLPDTLFAKFVSRIPANRKRAAERGVFQSEIDLYKNLGNMMPINMPRMYFGLAEETSDVAVLLLEEIDGVAKSGLPGVEEWSLTESEAKLALRELSGMHSRLWKDETLSGHSWLAPVDSGRRQQSYQVYKQAWKGLRDAMAPAFSPSEMLICDGLAGFLPTLLSELKQMPMTFCHGDYHSGNLMWDELGEPSTVWAVDWSASSIGPAVHDVANLLGMCVARDELKFVRQEYLPEYHASLVKGGVNDYGYERFLSDYRYGVLDVLQRMTGMLAVLDLARPDGVEVVQYLLGNLAAAADDAGCKSLMP